MFALVTATVLRRSGSAAGHVVYFGFCCKREAKALRREGVATRSLPNVSGALNRSLFPIRVRRYFPKIALFRALAEDFSDGQRVLLLDLDAIPRYGVDELFNMPDARGSCVAAADMLPTFQMNTGVMACRVHPLLFTQLLVSMREVAGTLHGDSDQDFLHYHFQGKAQSIVALPGQYNTFASDIFANNRGRSDVALALPSYIKVVHYVFGGPYAFCNSSAWCRLKECRAATPQSPFWPVIGATCSLIWDVQKKWHP